jgi:hypothetical protein
MTVQEQNEFLGVYAGVLFIVYFFPACIAGLRRHPSKWGIIALNILLGWTFIGWVGALIWALVKPTPMPVPIQQTVIYMTPQAGETMQPQTLVTSAPSPEVKRKRLEEYVQSIPVWLRWLGLVIIGGLIYFLARPPS